MRRSVAATLVAGLFALSACASAPSPSAPVAAASTPEVATATAPSPSTTAAATATARPTGSSPSLAISPTPSLATGTLASGKALPVCTPGEPKASDTVAFVASGHAWALDPSGGHLTCLFAVVDPGPFAWGPLGDRVLLGGLEIKGVAGGPSLARSGEAVATSEWSRPTGKSLIYAPASDTSLRKLYLSGAKSLDVTPVALPRYLSVAYHPSGEAFAFAVERDGKQAIWISSNEGKRPERMVFSNVGTTFPAIAFDVDGKHLLYAAQHGDAPAELHTIDVTDPTQAPLVWTGQAGQRILDIHPGRKSGTVAWTAATSACADSVAMAQLPSGIVRALPDVGLPTRAIGWLGTTKLLVATGGCDGPVDLSAVDLAKGSIVPLVSGVAMGAVRTPVPTPAAPLPKLLAATVGSGFG
jgi:hypothetical protein